MHMILTLLKADDLIERCYKYIAEGGDKHEQDKLMVDLELYTQERDVSCQYIERINVEPTEN